MCGYKGCLTADRFHTAGLRGAGICRHETPRRARQHGAHIRVEARELSAYGGVFSRHDCDPCASLVGGAALRPRFLPASGRDAGRGTDLGRDRRVNDRNYTALRFTMRLCGLASLSPVGARKATFGRMWAPRPPRPHAPLKPRLSRRLRETGGREKIGEGRKMES